MDCETHIYFLSTYPRGLNDQRGSEFIDGVALEEYADEQDDYAQEREIEACIKAVDVDCDGKIGESMHLQRGMVRATELIVVLRSAVLGVPVACART